jgi:hypothetical protein
VTRTFNARMWDASRERIFRKDALTGATATRYCAQICAISFPRNHQYGNQINKIARSRGLFSFVPSLRESYERNTRSFKQLDEIRRPIQTSQKIPRHKNGTTRHKNIGGIRALFSASRRHGIRCWHDDGDRSFWLAPAPRLLRRTAVAACKRTSN